VRVVVAPDSFGGTLDAGAAAEAIAAGWRRAAPADELRLLPVSGGTGSVVRPAPGRPWLGLDAELDLADLAVTGQESFDWRSLRDTVIPTVAGAAAARGLPCLVLAVTVSVGRREAASVGVDSAYAIADDTRDRGPSAGEPAGGDAWGDDPAGALAALAQRVAARWSR
jgi:glycerate kinase